MRCHYEVLGVARDADDDDLKRAYRKLALQWHPDKHAGTPESVREAEGRFKEIQAAYEVLRDANERRWYDAHRESILRGKAARHGGGGDDDDDDYEEDPFIDLWPFFSTSCFKDDKDFVRVYDEVFSKISDAEEKKHSPFFGDEARLGEFYEKWTNFVSSRSFAWAEKYNLNEAPNRMYRRAMEKENKKARDAARKEFQERVRQLATFVKKLDKRWARFQEALRKKEAEKKEQEKKNAEDVKIRRRKVFQEYVVAEDVEEHMQEAERQSEILDEYFENLSVKGKGKNSKKRQAKNPKKMQYVEEEEADAEEQELDTEQQQEPAEPDCSIDAKADDGEQEEEEEEEEEEVLSLDLSNFRKPRNGAFDASSGISSNAAKSPDAVLEKHSAKTAHRGDADDGGGDDDVGDGDGDGDGDQPPDDTGDDDTLGASGSRKKSVVFCDVCKKKFLTDKEFEGHTKTKKHLHNAKKSAASSAKVDASAAAPAAKERKQPVPKKTVIPAPDSAEESSEEEVVVVESQSSMGRKARRKEKDTSVKCNRCGEQFESKNKLFQHIEETGHALHVEPAQSGKRKK
eukprot:ANDGO_01688.mRNA.1 J protein JJJ1